MVKIYMILKQRSPILEGRWTAFSKTVSFAMSIYDNIAYGPRIHEERIKKIRPIVEHFLKTASLWDEVKDKLHSPASRLSVGQQQRLCLARDWPWAEIILGMSPLRLWTPNQPEY